MIDQTGVMRNCWYRVQCTKCSVQSTVYKVQWTKYSVQSTVYRV